MDNFDAHKWFKKQYLEEGMSDEDKVVAKGDDIEITQKQMERLHNGEVVRLSNGSVLSFVKEGHTEDKTERDQAIRRYDQLSDDDKLKLAKIQKMMDKERSLKEDEPEDDMHDDPGDIRIDHDYYTEDLNEIAFGAAGTDKRTGQVVGEIIELIISTGVDVYEVMEELGQEFGMDVRP
jgi:glucosamine 6-phosphate synthetase-like amidotransferase/phosphosugar isomerase protein